MFVKINKIKINRLAKRILYDLSIIIVSVGAVYFVAAVYAGNLTPPGLVAPTMNTLENIYHILADPSYVPSAPVTAKENGNVMEILKCITNKMNGGVCI